MEQLAKRLLVIYPDLDLKDSVIVQDDLDGLGPHIVKWDDHRAQPTDAELLAVSL